MLIHKGTLFDWQMHSASYSNSFRFLVGLCKFCAQYGTGGKEPNNSQCIHKTDALANGCNKKIATQCLSHHSLLSSFIPSTPPLIHACGKVHQKGRVVMIKKAMCLLNYVYATESEITELTVNDSFEYLGRGQRPCDIHTLLLSSPLPPYISASISHQYHRALL